MNVVTRARVEGEGGCGRNCFNRDGDGLTFTLAPESGSGDDGCDEKIRRREFESGNWGEGGGGRTIRGLHGRFMIGE